MNPCRIAIVEDESIVAMQIEERLIAMGYELAGRAASGEQALVIVEQNRPDLILMDIRLQGGMDGIAAAEEIRRRFHLPVIFLTAYSEDATLERAKLAEPFGYILKPFDDRELRSTIEIARYKHAAEEEIRRLNRLYDVLSQVNQVIVRIESREELLQEVCRIVVERGAVDIAWFGRLDPNTARINTVAHFGGPNEILGKAEFYADDRPEGQGNPGKAIRENKPFVCNECAGNGCLYPLAYAPMSFGLKSCGSFPIHFQGRIYGTLNIGVARAAFFREREIALLEEVAGDVSFALDKIEADVQRERAEVVLRESQSRLEALFAAIPDVIVEFDRSLRPVMANQAALRVLGYTSLDFTRDEAVSKMRFSKLDGSRIEADNLPSSRALNGDVVLGEPYSILTADGTERVILVYSVPLYKDGKINGVVALWHDVTQLKQTEDALRQSEEMYRTLITASPDAIVVTDLSGRITVVSQKTLGLFGIPSEQHAIGRSIWEWFARRTELQTERAMQHLATGGQAPPAEFVLKKKDGTVFDAEVHASPLRTPDGTVRGAILIIRDVSERKNLQAQLLQAQKMEAIGTLAGGIAHDFNNILMALMGYTGIMAMKIPEDNPLRRYVDQIHHCAGKAANLTQSLLAFSRKQAIELKPQTVNTIVKDLEKLLRRIVPEDVELILALNEDVTIMADMTQIDQVLINLVSNARDAMPKGGTLLIETGAVQLDRGFKQVNGFGEPGAYALISVIDTGSGMDQATQKKIFEPFFTTKEIGKGTGLGLSIGYGIIKQHGGYITVLSEPGKGTTFRIYLPVTKMEVSETRQVSSQVSGGTETILLAEDDSEMRRIAGEILRTSGYTVLEAKDGEDAVKQYIEHRDSVDLLILDVVMPGMNGKEAYEKIRGLNTSVKVIFMSGYTGDVVFDKGVRDTGLNFVSKPVLTEKLLMKVRCTLDG